MTVVAILPVWDPETQKQIGAPDSKTPLDGFTKLINSGFIRERHVLVGQIRFYNYLTQTFVPTTNIHICILSSDEPEISIKQVLAYWPR